MPGPKFDEVPSRYRADKAEFERSLMLYQSHAQYAGDAFASETKEHVGELTRFFDKYLGK